MYANYTQCIPEKSLDLTITALDRALLHFVFPLQFLLGVIGNLLILWVICSDNFKNRANDLLAAVSFADLSFLILMLPHSMATFEKLERNLTFRLIYLHSKQHLGALANWMSASAIWLILAVSVERFLVIRSPLRSRIYWRKGVKYSVLLSIFIATGILTIYHHIAYDCEIFFTCSGTQLSQACYSAAQEYHPVSWMDQNIIHTPLLKRHYIKISTLGNAIMVVFIPIVIVVVLNILLVRQLHINEKMAVLYGDGTSLKGVHPLRQKYRVTVTVVAIAFCFSLTQGPSAVMVLWELIDGYANKSAQFLTIFSITNILVVFGKMANFILFCFFSTHFRRKFFTLVCRKFTKLSQGSTMTHIGRQGSVNTVRGSIVSSLRQSQYGDSKQQHAKLEKVPLKPLNSLTETTRLNIKIS